MIKTSCKVGTAVALLCSAGITPAAVIDLDGIGYVQYGDGLSYSMPLAQYQTTGDVTPTPGDQFYIASSPGKIQNLVVPATGVNGGPTTTNFTGMDDAYSTPSGVSGENFFQTGGLTFDGNTYPASDPGGVGQFANDYADTWDATLASLSTFLADDQLVFFFNNNQLNKTSNQQSLAAWAQLWITDGDGKVVGDYFEFTNHDSPYKLVSEGGGGVVLGDPTSYTSLGPTDPGYNSTNGNTDYVLSGGGICLDAAANVVSCSDVSAVVGPVNHNLGANNAAYAVVFPELNDQMDGLIANLALDLTKYTLHVDVRLGCDPTLFGTDAGAAICTGDENDPNNPWGKNLTNGYEQIFIGTLSRPDGVPGVVPEPATLVLMGLGLAGLGMARRRRN